jgi:N-acetylglucosaminyl-diphospho-decaprenol L-rhamnosyltransferase
MCPPAVRAGTVRTLACLSVWKHRGAGGHSGRLCVPTGSSSVPITREGRKLAESADETDCLTLAVIVVTYNSEGVVAGLIESLPVGLAGCHWSLAVADNHSADGTVGLVNSIFPGAHVVEMTRNAGYAAGINAALAVSEPSAAALILNADVRLREGAGVAMLHTLRRSGAGIVVPRLVDLDGTTGYSLRREPNIRRSTIDAVFGNRVVDRFGSWSEAVNSPQSYLHETRADWASGAAMLISRECLESCGPWDESFFLYSEETEYCLRARDRGFPMVLAPDAEVVHLGGESRVSPRLRSLLVVNRVRLYGRRHSRVPTGLFWLIEVMREGSRAALGRRASQQAFMTLISRRRMREAPLHASEPDPA